MTNLIGYARISSISQNLDAEIDNLKQADCEKIFSHKISGTTKYRPGWNDLSELNRMSRSLSFVRNSRRIKKTSSEKLEIKADRAEAGRTDY